jgi:two-component system, NtrC family, sensor histidine kinase KinB
VILFANEQALQLLNLTETDIVGRNRDEVQAKNDLFRFLVNEKNNIPFRIVLDGKENYFSKEIIDISQQEENTGIVIVLKNITSFKELDTAKTNFIATISHELKTPLASSDFSLKLLEDERVGGLSAEQKELVNSLKDDNQRMLRILSELLDLSQVESGKIRLDMEPVQPRLLIEKAMASVRNVAKDKNITINTDIPGSIPVVHADADKTAWVLNNFLTNAIRYAPGNSQVNISVSEVDGKICFTVRDSGKGIEAQYKEKIFDRYFKVPGTSEGTGLGLAICKEFIEAQGGKIWVDSEPGKGSTFAFSLPHL